MDRFQLIPGKFEMVGGKFLWSDEDRETLLGLLLENVGPTERFSLVIRCLARRRNQAWLT